MRCGSSRDSGSQLAFSFTLKPHRSFPSFALPQVGEHVDSFAMRWDAMRHANLDGLLRELGLHQHGGLNRLYIAIVSAARVDTPLL